MISIILKYSVCMLATLLSREVKITAREKMLEQQETTRQSDSFKACEKLIIQAISSYFLPMKLISFTGVKLKT